MEIQLSKIFDNPYQPRTTDNAEHIESLARSIAADGLLQVPTARQVEDGTYQLAFGHSRRKAFEWLKANWTTLGLPNRYDAYNEMPVNVEPIGDEDMYRFAVAENVQRKDLDAIEIAEAMVVYRDQFGKSSKEIGELFGMNDATVRGKIALLKLPAVVTTALSEGKISESAARLLNSLNKVLPEGIEDALGDIIGDPDIEYVTDAPTPVEVVDSVLRESKKIVELRTYTSPWKNEKKFPNKHLPILTATQALKVINKEADYSNKQVMGNLIEALGQNKPMSGTFYGDTDNAMVSHLVRPPSCTACDYHITLDGSSYCGIKLCFERKNEAWKLSILTKASKDLGIAIYNEGADGEALVLTKRDKEHCKLFESGDANLRVTSGSSNSYFSFEGVPDGVSVVLIGDSVAKTLEKEAKKREKEKAAHPSYGSEEYKKQEALRAQRINAIHRFAWEVCAPLIIPLIAITHQGLLKEFLGEISREELPDEVEVDKDFKGKTGIDQMRQLLAYRILFATLDWNDKSRIRDHKTPVQAYGKWALNQLTTWGVKTPKNWMETALAYEAVSMETEEPKGKKK